MANQVESTKAPLLSARQVGIAAAFGGAALAVVAAGLLIPIPGTLVVTDPRELFTTIGASLTGPIGGIVIGFLAGIADPLPIVAVVSHVLGGVFNGFVYKHASWRFKDNKPVSLALWAAQVLAYYFLIIVPLIVALLMIFHPDPESGGFFSLLGVIELGAVPEALITTVITTIVMAALPEKYRRPLW